MHNRLHTEVHGERQGDAAYHGDAYFLSEPFTVAEMPEALARRNEVVAKCEELYDAAKSTAEKARHEVLPALTVLI